MLKLIIKAETVKKECFREYSAEGSMADMVSGMSITVANVTAYARSQSDGTVLIHSFLIDGRNVPVTEYQRLGFALDMSEATATFADGLAAAEEAHEAARKAKLAKAREEAYAKSIHCTIAPMIEAAGFKTDKQTLEDFKYIPRLYFMAKKEGGHGRAVEVREDGKWFVASIGYERGLKKKTQSQEKVLSCVEEMWALGNKREAYRLAAEKAKEARKARLADVIGDGAKESYDGNVSATLGNDKSATATENWNKTVTLTLNGLTAEQAKAVMALVRGM